MYQYYGNRYTLKLIPILVPSVVHASCYQLCWYKLSTRSASFILDDIFTIIQFKELAIGTGESSLSKWTHSEKPQFIFELEYNDEQETKFQSIAHSHGVLFAYHGSSVENFHSILHNGLLNLFNKVHKIYIYFLEFSLFLSYTDANSLA